MPMRPCWVEIRTHSLEDNYRFLQSLAPSAELLAIVKADAYGHSLALCAPAAVRAGARWLGVTSVEEGVAARKVCSQARILVIGGVFPGQGAAVVEHCLTPTVWEPGQLDELEAAARVAGLSAGSLPVHLEIDTGMSRQGVSLEILGAVLQRFGADSPLSVEGVMTHLYASDDADGAATEAQLKRLDQAVDQITKALTSAAARPEWLSVGATAALLGGDADAISALAGRWGMRAMLRPGLALYGVAPRFDPPFDPGREPATLVAARANLHPVLSWKTRVVSVRAVPAGTDVGYNGTFVATEPMRLALLAVGYADGLDRKLGNRFSLLVGGQRAPIVGRISMDQTVIDVTEIPEVEAGEEVVILGSQGGESITAFDHAQAAGTISWEVFTRIAPRVQRVEV
jgi:alanine racemase